MSAPRGRAALVARLRSLALDPDSGWQVISPSTVRWTWADRPTPATLPRSWWPDPTYSSHVFVTAVGDKFVVGAARCPWTTRRDIYATQSRVHEILDDPRAFLD